MSYSLVTLSCVVVFLSIIPHTTLAPIVEDSADWTAIKTFVLEKGDLNPGCTAPIGDAMDTLVTAIQREVKTLTSTVTANDIKTMVTSLFAAKTALDTSESNKVYAFVAERTLFHSKCTSVLPTLETGSSLRKSLLDEISELISQDDLSSKTISAACLASNILQALQASSSSFPSPAAEVVNNIIGVVSAMKDDEITGIGTEEIIPTFDTVSSSYEAGKTNLQIVNYIGSPPNDDVAKRCIVFCFLLKAQYSKHNPQLPPEQRKKLVDHLYDNYQLAEDCSVAPAPTFEEMAAELVKQGRLLAGVSEWTVQTTIDDVIDKAKLTESDKESAMVSVGLLALPPPTCSAKSPLLAGNNELILATAFARTQAVLGSDRWDQKKLGYKCWMHKSLNEVKASLDVAVESPSKEIIEELKAAVVERKKSLVARSAGDHSASKTTAVTVNPATLLAEITKAYNLAKEKTKTKEWMGSDAGKHATVLCMIDTLVTEESSKPKGDDDWPGLSNTMILIIALAVVVALIIVIALCCLVMRKG